SLRNIFIEMADDVGGPVRTDGDLTYLAKQGVFLINTILTVERSKPLSHNIPEYKTLIVKVLEELNKRPQPIVFILWGSYARSFKKYINGPNKLVIESNHPSPLSANRGGFFGTRPFSRANNFLAKHGSNVINW
nr:uracil-DNA glycosylase [Bacilli bacterium]